MTNLTLLKKLTMPGMAPDLTIGSVDAEHPDLVTASQHVEVKVPVEGIAIPDRCYAMNPKAVERNRERFRMSGAKSDLRDAWVLATMLRTDR